METAERTLVPPVGESESSVERTHPSFAMYCTSSASGVPCAAAEFASASSTAPADLPDPRSQTRAVWSSEAFQSTRVLNR